MRRVSRSRFLRQFPVLLMVLPLLLAACGDTAPAPTAGSTGAATTAATRPATTASGTTAATAAATTAGSTSATVAAPAATTGAAMPAAMGRVENLTLPATSKRGEGGTLRLLWWQAPTILNLHLAAGTKDYDASRPVNEPLATFSNAGALTPDVPVLAKEIPSAQNGGLSADGTSVTWKLKDGVTWSDGMPFTAEDVISTYRFITNKANGSTTISTYDAVQDIIAPDKATVKITFKGPTPAWFSPFSGVNGAVLPKHLIDPCNGMGSMCPFNIKPVGTGPYVVTDFRSGDSVLYTANEKFREPNAPYFAKVEMKGGGDATTAVKAVQTGAADYAWNPQVTPDIYTQFEQGGGVLLNNPGTGAEKLFFNFADPSIEVDGEKSSPKSKNPFFTDKNVRMAVAMAIDRTAMAKNLYGVGGKETNTLIPGLYEGLPFEFSPMKASALLEMAGWKMGPDGVRVKDGKRFAITFRTSVTPVRDRESLLIQQNLKAVGIAVELKPVDSSVFFGQPDNPDQRVRFETDLSMYTNSATSPDLQSFLKDYTTDQIAQKSNGWKSTNLMRWSNSEYDKIMVELNRTLDGAKRVELFKKADQILIGDYAQVPLVARRNLGASSKGLTGVNLTTWDSDVWNIAHWTKAR